MFCLPPFPFLCGFWDFFDSFKKSKSSQKTPKEHVEICIWFWKLNWKIETNSLEWSVFENTDITVSKMNCCRIIIHRKTQQEHQRKQRQQRQMQQYNRATEGARAVKDRKRSSTMRSGENRRCRAKQTANARTASGRSSGAIKLRMARNWRQWSQTAWIRSERRADGKTERKRENSRKRADGDMRGDCSRISTNARTSLERRSGDVSFSCSEWHVLSTYF